MKLSEICIDRPVMATVFSLIIVLFGFIAYPRLAVREYPDIEKPMVSVTTILRGAAAEVVETSVTQFIEDEVIGIEGVKHVTSSSREEVSDIQIEFELSRNLEDAANDVRDRVALARRNLPDDIDDPIISKSDTRGDVVVWLSLSGDGVDPMRLTEISENQIKDRLSKLPGVSSLMIGGERRFSMRIWIDSRLLTAKGLTIADVAAALQRENVDIPSGRIEGVNQEFTVRSLGEMHSVEEFEMLPVAKYGDTIVYLRDVAKVAAGPEDERKALRFNGRPSIGLGVVKRKSANTLDVARAVKDEVKALSTEMPPGVRLVVAYDSSKFIEQSIHDVWEAIVESVILVILVIFFFLRSMRATLIPALAIPVSIIGTFAVLYFSGYSINTLTLMGITLAIGLVVDDAIVVLENVTRWVEEGHTPYEAAKEGMREISFAVVSATISVAAVFLPLLFLTDQTGRLFGEFGITVAASVLISGFVALTLTPMLCARIVKSGHAEETGLRAVLRDVVEYGRNLYEHQLLSALRQPKLWLVLGIVWFVIGLALLTRIDSELVPDADQGTIYAMTIAPVGSTIEYTERYQLQAEEILLATPEVENLLSIVALGMNGPGQVNRGFFFVMLDDQRKRSQEEVFQELAKKLWMIPGMQVFTFKPKALSQSITSSPLELVIQGNDLQRLNQYADEVVQRAQQVPGIVNLQSNLSINKPQLEVKIDRDRAADLGVSARDIAQTLQILLGGLDLSTFKLDGRSYDVIAQLQRERRSKPEDMLELFVRGRGGELIPLSSVVSAQQDVSPREIPHYDRLRSAKVEGHMTDAISQGEALRRIREVAEEVLPKGEGYQVQLSGEAETYFDSQRAMQFAYLLALVIVYLTLAIQFESFVHPFTILVAAALSFTGALVALLLFGKTLNIFSQIGLLMLIGLVTKNSILIVEFANQLRERGVGLFEAVREASSARFRPILMTALSTIAGLMPIALGLGAGGESRSPLGIAVVGGMFFSTVLTIIVVPAVYLLIEGLRVSWRERARSN